MIDYQPPPHTQLNILHQDDAILVVVKPAELLSVPGRAPEHQDCLASRVQSEFPGALIVHRLDMSTSGLMVFARTAESHRHLNRQFEQRSVGKTYCAIVSGRMEQQEETIDLPLIRDWPNRPRQIVDHENGKQAQTRYRVLSYDTTDDTSRVELYPLTGRTHQLRVHMKALGHPILGDDLYADEITFNKADRLLLHASALSFTHPLSLKTLTFEHSAPF